MLAVIATASISLIQSYIVKAHVSVNCGFGTHYAIYLEKCLGKP